MAGDGRKSGRAAADELLATGLACGLTIEAAAAKASLSVRTAYRRRADPAFVALVRSLRAELVQQATGQLLDGSRDAVAVLRALLADKELPPALRLAAAKAVLEQAQKWCETQDLSEQLQELKAEVEGMQRP